MHMCSVSPSESMNYGQFCVLFHLQLPFFLLLHNTMYLCFVYNYFEISCTDDLKLDN